MKRMLSCLALAAIGVTASIAAQSPDVNKVLADARAALGGEKKREGGIDQLWVVGNIEVPF